MRSIDPGVQCCIDITFGNIEVGRKASAWIRVAVHSIVIAHIQRAEDIARWPAELQGVGSGNHVCKRVDASSVGLRVADHTGTAAVQGHDDAGHAYFASILKAVSVGIEPTRSPNWDPVPATALKSLLISAGIAAPMINQRRKSAKEGSSDQWMQQLQSNSGFHTQWFA